jgi:hypothetical protein
MAERQDDSSGESADAAKASAPSPKNETHSGANAPVSGDGQAASEGRNPASEPSLPTVEAPKLGGGEASGEEGFATPPAFVFGAHFRRRAAQDEASGGPAANSVAAAARPRSYRFAMFAAIIALAAGAGSVAGSLTATGFVHHDAAAATVAKSTDAREIVQALKAQHAQLSALKLNAEAATRSASSQFARLTERLDSLEHAEADHATKLSQLAESIDKLDKRSSAAPEITGSIAAPPQASTSLADAPILNDWIVQEVHAGRAMVESRYGGYFLVGPGSVLPGLGRVEAVKRQNGAWIVVTARGIIVSQR